ncbi:DUF2798 domain-containing protein [Chryseobacterium muglaense]|uniref:DUF2798 domain-containing protein n=1 Tax=Chryseobacterium muglaense TaxID=2893752 RepID=A0ABR8LY57_9FLAO|nr:DUF2798 domain-containing protein [Chryseobacterium muglaense]
MKLSEKNAFILFVLLVSISMSAVMSFGIILLRLGFVEGFLRIWLSDFLVGCCLAIPTSFVLVPLLKKWTDNMSR